MLLDKRLGVIEAVDGDNYYVKFWELIIPAKLSKDFKKVSDIPKVGDDVSLSLEKGRQIRDNFRM